MYIPGELKNRTINDVAYLMSVRSATFTEIPQDVTSSDNFFLPSDDVDFSLAAQTTPLLDEAEAVFFTANSAIPVADTIRGIFDALGQESPLLAWIETKTGGKREIERLETLLDGRQNVAVVDQYVGTGSTCERSRRLLEAAGALTVTPIMGRWYHGVHPDEANIDFKNVSSKYAKRMHEIGEQVLASATSLAN